MISGIFHLKIAHIEPDRAFKYHISSYVNTKTVSMKVVWTLSLILSLTVVSTVVSQNSRQGTLKSDKGVWAATINKKGAITNLEMSFNGETVRIPWRTDEQSGPAWEGIDLTRVAGESLRFEGSKDDILYNLEYKDVDGILTLVVGLKNKGSKPFAAEPSIGIRLGIDHEMKDPKAYFDKFFPTLLRCEKTHFWGYFQNPNGQILTISSSDPVASREIGYIGMTHRIATSTLHPMHVLPLPRRHPQELVELAPGEERSWSIQIEPADSLDDVLPTIAANTKAPTIGLNRTIAAPGETLEMAVYFDTKQIPEISVRSPSGEIIELPKPEVSDQKLLYTITAPEDIGNYTLQATTNGKRTEAIFHVRKPWGWYLEQARSEALRMQIKPMMHREGWLGFFSAYWAHTFFPDEDKLTETEKIFDNFYTLMVDSTKTDFYHDKPTWHVRPQNTSWMVGMMTARYAATKKIEDLEEAAKWGDLLISKFQKPNGAFEGYTALTLGGKFLRELAFYERPFAEKDSEWKQRYERHMKSVEKASQNLLVVKDMGDTEGESTYEDTQSGSAWSLLALHALNSDDEKMRNKFLEGSLKVQKRHECLTQALIPDARMRNGSLRFWESQYDILTLPNMMNSPHGWTMRSQFGAFYLYLLTGEERYLNIMNNAMGACVQAIDEKTGTLRWAFVPDPYILAERFVPDPENSGQGKRVPEIVGEQWMPMISDWWRVPDGEIAKLDWKRNGYHGFSQGWSCDNDVHEHFRVLAEQFVPNAFVLEREDGSLRTMNCEVERKEGILLIKLPEDVVSRVHLNLKKPYKIKIPFASETVEQNVEKGMRWVGPGGMPELLR